MKNKSEVTNYDKIAESYVKTQKAFFSKFKDPSKEAIFKIIPKELSGKICLDAGCGSGADAEKLLKRGAIVFGIDNSSKMIRLARKNNPEIQFDAQEIEKTKFKNNFFDLIISRFAVHYLKEPEKGIKELYRILKPKGTLAFLVPHPIFDLEFKKSKDYAVKENVVAKVFNSTLALKYPSHTFSDYLSPFVLKNFEIKLFQEQVKIGERKSRNCFLMLKLEKN